MDAHLRIEAMPATSTPHDPVTHPEVGIYVVDDNGDKHVLNGVTSINWRCGPIDEPDFTRCTLELEGVEFDGELPLSTVFLLLQKPPGARRVPNPPPPRQPAAVPSR